MKSEGSNDLQLQARVTGSLSQLCQRGDSTQAMALSHRGLDLSERLGDPHLTGLAYEG